MLENIRWVLYESMEVYILLKIAKIKTLMLPITVCEVTAK